MARISTYPIDATPNLDDKVIGTDVNDSNITKNYTIESILDLYQAVLSPQTLWYGGPLSTPVETATLLYINGGLGTIPLDTTSIKGTAVMSFTNIDDDKSVSIGEGTFNSPGVSLNEATALGVKAGVATQISYSELIGYQAGPSTDVTMSVIISNAANEAATIGQSVLIGRDNFANIDAAGQIYNSVCIGTSNYKDFDGISVLDEVVIGQENAEGLLVGSNKNIVIGLRSAQGNGTSTVLTDNIILGYEAAFAADGPAFGNIIIGKGAGSQLATGPGPASNNIVIGNGAGKEITAEYCIGIGENSLSTLCTGGNNTAVGRSSLENNGEGEANTAVGAYALENCQDGNLNTAIGYFAGNVLATPENITCLGYNSQALGNDEVVLGDGNVAILRCNTAVISAISDERDKKDIKNAPSGFGLSFINQLKPRVWEWDRRDEKDAKMAGKKDMGFIAQELKTLLDASPDAKQAMPNLLDERNPDRMAVGPAALIPVLVKAVQQLSAEVDALKGTKKG
tara:strand:+ start:8014 stop:9549 length:1536 start_codon:yes stop_codon:yes gene_type:complete